MRGDQQLDPIFDAIPSLVFVKDDANRVLRVNRAVLDALGLSRSEVEGRHSAELFPNDAERFYADDLEVIRSGEPKLGYVERAGDRWVRTDKTPIRNDDGVIDRLLVVATDVTELKLREQRQAEANRLLEVTTRIAHVGGWEYQIEPPAISWSDEVCRIHGVEPGHCPGLEEAIAYYTPDCRDVVTEAVRRGVEKHEPWELDVRIRAADGSIKWVRAIGQPEIVQGECVRLWGTLQDVSAQVAARRELRRSKVARDHSNEAVYWVREDGSFFYANDAACQMLGHERDQLLRMRVSDIDPDYPDPVWAEHWSRMKRERFMRLETKHRDAEGGWVWVEMSIHYYEFEGEEFVVGAARDVTEVVRAREALIQSEERLDLALTNANVGLWDWDAATDRVFYSETTKTQLGYPATAPWDHFREWESRLHPEDRDAATARVRDYISGKADTYDSTFRLRAADGSYRWIRSIGRGSFTSEGQAERVTGIHVDVTEQQTQRRDLERANRELKDFAYVASHDLKAPLRAVDHLAGWLADDLAGTLPESSAKHLAQLKQRVGRMETLLDDLLSYSRAGRSSGLVSEIDLGELVVQTESLLDKPEGFRVETSLSVTQFRGHRTPLETVIRNLLSNAIKHHDLDTGVIRVESRGAGEMIELAVIDDGPGIAPEFRDRAFAMFQTLKPRDEVEGSGMGLALVKKLVESEAGRVWAETADPRGLVVRFTWPAEVQESV